MKYAYVLVSGQSDFYWEQTYLSMCSLRYYNPGATISLVVDTGTSHTLTGTRAELLKIVDEFKVVEVDSLQSKKVRSRILKTTIREIISGDFLYLDCDTVILNRLPNVPEVSDICAVYLYHYVNLSQSPSYYSVKCVMDLCGESANNESFFNGGVYYVADTPLAHRFFQNWNATYIAFLDEYMIDDDQPSFYVTNNKLNDIIKPLPPEWNYQVGYGLEYLQSALVFHYLISTCKNGKNPIHILQQEELMRDIRSHVGDMDYIVPIIRNARLSFLPNVRATAEPLEWTTVLSRIKRFGENRSVCLFGPGVNNKMANFLFKQANVAIKSILQKDELDRFPNDKTKVGIIVLGAQNDLEELVAQLARKGFIHFLPMAIDR